MAERFTVVITSDRYGADDSELAREREIVTRYPHLDIELKGIPAATEDELIAMGNNADALLISTREALTPRVLASLPRVKVISRYGVGLDNIDLDAATDNGIVVTHYPQYCTSEVADHAMALLLALNRRIVEQDADLHRGAWNIHRAATTSIQRGPVPALRELILGIVGFGRIGQAVAKRAAPFGMRLIAADPYQTPEAFEEASVRQTDLDRLMREADLVTIHAPLTPETRGIITSDRIRSLKRDAAIVNTARGPIIDLDALATVLSERPDLRAGLDVVDPEPLPSGSPLYNLPNVILTPHAAYYSTRSVELVRSETLVAALDVLSGTLPATVANPAVLAQVKLRQQGTA